MRRRRLDPETAERLLRGAVDDPREPETIAEIAAVVRSHQPAIPLTSRSRSMSARNHSAKVAVGVFAGVLSTAGVAAAAAGGHLPDAAQDAVAHAASHVGLSVQDSATHGKSGEPHGNNGVTPTVHSNVAPPCPNAL